MNGGYMGRVLQVNLTTGSLRDEGLTENLCRDYIGGYGFGVKELFSRLKPGVDALGPDNILGFMTGPLTGTPAPTGARYTVFAKSPLTGGWGDANSGGYFGPRLKFAGYDGVMFTGRSKDPVYLWIKDGKAELRAATCLWGKDSFDTEDILKSELGADVEVACIGPSGEQQSLIAAVMNNKGRAAGRSGLGAVMGSKRLKAIAVAGNADVPLADKNKANEIRRNCLAQLTPISQFFKGTGTPGTTLPSAQNGDSPVKNWGGVGVADFLNAKALGVEQLAPLIAKRYGCWHCPLACGGIMKEGKGEYDYGKESHRPEYETLAMFGSNCLNSNLESIIKANDICNRYGVDTISAGAAIAFAIECYENGILSKTDTDGLELTWGNYRAIVTMTDRLCRREGLGAVLADGVRKAAAKIGKGAEQYAMHIGGQEVPAHDPKLGPHYYITYQMNATPARHTQGHEGLNPPGLLPRFNTKSYSGRAQAHRIASNILHVINCVGMCEFMYWSLPSADVVTDFLNAATGWNLTTDDLVKTGERIATLRHAFNLREGLNPLKTKVPGRIFGRPPLQAGPLKGVTVDVDTLVNEYLKVMDWDPITAKPSAQRLRELGLEDVAGALGS
jgi:aldehyde:ferredoxin oxidoreductase